MLRINVTLDDQETRILNALIKKYGGKPAAVIRESLKFRYDKMAPAYVKVKGAPTPLIDPEDLTPEQICEQIPGGKVTRENGNMMCEVGTGTGITNYYLLGSDELAKEWKKAQKNP